MIVRALSACLFAATIMPSVGYAMITEQEWTAYAARFVSSEGRVIDDGNGGISHSEGQGYGLLLAYLADNRPAFERIWSFTRRELLLRDDNLAAWKWDPGESPHITDLNNASDGDILIAYALALAGSRWQEDRFTMGARDIASALARTSILVHQDRLLLLPGVAGFNEDARPDGPVVNLSYWIFEAFPVMETLVPDVDWEGLSKSGETLIAEASFGRQQLPADWVSVAGEPQPAEGFPAEFGYNAVRIPLYLMRDMNADEDLLRRLRDGMATSTGAIRLVDFSTGMITAELNDVGYRIIPALAACVLDDEKLGGEFQTFVPTLYYPSTLQLLALSHVREERPECL